MLPATQREQASGASSRLPPDMVSSRVVFRLADRAPGLRICWLSIHGNVCCRARWRTMSNRIRIHRGQSSRIMRTWAHKPGNGQIRRLQNLCWRSRASNWRRIGSAAAKETFLARPPERFCLEAPRKPEQALQTSAPLRSVIALPIHHTVDLMNTFALRATLFAAGLLLPPALAAEWQFWRLAAEGWHDADGNVLSVRHVREQVGTDSVHTGTVDNQPIRIGRDMAVLAGRFLSAGPQSVAFDGASLPSGMYFYTLRTDTGVDTRSMLLLK